MPAQEPYRLAMLPHHHLDVFFAANAAEMMVGYKGHTAHALPLDELRRVMGKYGRV